MRVALRLGLPRRLGGAGGSVPVCGGGVAWTRAALVHYAARRRRGEPISTAFVESAVNAIVAKRLNKRQQMRWSRATVQPFLDVRTAVLNDTLEDAFRHRYPGFRPANDDQASFQQQPDRSPRFCMLFLCAVSPF